MMVGVSLMRRILKIDNSYELYEYLKNLNLIEHREERWWPNSGTFEVVVGAILTQNAKWEKVEISLENLRKFNLLDLESLRDTEILTEAIEPSGLYRQKSERLKLLSFNILEEFGDFETFCSNVSREWLLEQKGIGQETADSILCYACKRDVMVSDSYSARILNHFGWEFESYDEVQSFLKSGIDDFYDGYKELSIVYAQFHGMIVEFCKTQCKGKKVNSNFIHPHKMR